ncbi:MAG TPA: MmcQ/YjbR family DNA-binding protein [Gemmatimonadaceae bacterium]|jgi:hypothetical protein
MATIKRAKKTAKRSTTKKRAAPKPRAKKSARSPEARVRELCLALPEAHEVEAWGAPTYRVQNKVFAMYIRPANHHHNGRPAVWICSTHVEQDLVVRARPTLYFKPPYVGPSGWIGAFLDGKPPWMEIAELLREGYRRRAPKKLAALLEE